MRLSIQAWMRPVPSRPRMDGVRPRQTWPDAGSRSSNEAHRLSPNAWDVYLKPLEAAINYSAYIFVTNSGSSIPQTIRSRCVRVRFSRVGEDIIYGLLASAASRDIIPYETAALKLIAHRSDGAPRNAMEYLGRADGHGQNHG